ncbi:hypothetical protein [Mesorhizobium sp. LNHC252B00]|uniref:hypothetical protein n=1 Tax=Mesorhizobium sp. LNHC252B00 TaxID=1287252 RepID=UPI0012EB216A|nr:hypothetical protein [Mesorhizobium sp. LNHC252B00]
MGDKTGWASEKIGRDVIWTTKNKRIELESVTPHAHGPAPGIRGRSPGVAEIRFTPQEMFGAMARCPHLHPIDPAAVTFESEGCRHLIAKHVNERPVDFSILPSVKRLKDFSRTHMIGVAGAAIAYLQMIRDGYVWCDHFENLHMTRKPRTRRSPDFVFSRPGDTDVALTESKATHGSSRKQFKRTVESGYLKQVEPHLGFEISGAVASHGFSMGSWMTSATRAELLIDHTAIPAPAGSDSPPSNPNVIRRGNYLTVLSLMFGPAIAAAARAGTWVPSETQFLAVHWLDRDWLIGLSDFPQAALWIASEDEAGGGFDSRHLRLSNDFALELGVARAFFSSLASPDDRSDPLAELGRMDDALIARARERGGAVFPDGFAVLGKDKTGAPVTILNWDPQLDQFKKEDVKVTGELPEPVLQHSFEAPTWAFEQEREKPKTERLRLTVGRTD